MEQSEHKPGAGIAVKRVAPWIVSLAIHGGVILLAVFITWTVTHMPSSSEEESVLIVADFNAMNYEPVAGFDPISAEQGTPAPMNNDLLQPLPDVPSVAEQLNAAPADPLQLISDLGSAAGKSDSRVSALSSFAPSSGPNAATFGGVTGTNARRIVYVIDASGSMVPYIRFVIDELTRSLSNLSPRQSFAVIFFKGNEAIEVPPAGRLVSADNEERLRALNWINANVTPEKGTNPIVAIRKAMDLKPDVIFLLSQNITGYGEFEVDQKDLLDLLDQLNPLDSKSGRRVTQINCIQFLDEDPLDTMRLIAERHGGPRGYKFMSRQELGLSPR